MRFSLVMKISNIQKSISISVPGVSDSKESASNAGDLVLIPTLQNHQEYKMAAHSGILLAWRIPWREETGGLQSMKLQRVGHD